MGFFRCSYCGKVAMKYYPEKSYINCFECGKEISCENPKQFLSILENIFTYLSDFERESVLINITKK